MGIFSWLFGRGSKELLVPCQNRECKKIFTESEGRNYEANLEQTGIHGYKCPACGEKFAFGKTKLIEIQAKVRKEFKSQK